MPESVALQLLLVWLQFLGLGTVIAIAGFHLCREGDRIGAALGFTGSWVGLALLATVTSLPELITGIVAVTAAQAPNIAVGNALGACALNLGFLVLVDFLYRRTPIYRSASQSHVLTASFGVVLIGFIGINLVVGNATNVTLPLLAHVGPYSPLLLIFYALALRTLFFREKAHAPERENNVPLARSICRFALAALAVIAAGAWLPFVSTDLASTMGWNRSFVGTLFVAVVTTLPELAITVSAIRMNAPDMAIGNLLGSNLFNAAIIAIDDLFYAQGSLLSHVSATHAATAFSAVIMSGLAIIGLLYRPGGRVLRSVGWISIGLAVLYLFNTYIAFTYGE
jgi:cation:H+ antiporter